MKDRKIILISNDDGIDARGLKSLIEMVKPFADLYVVAPEHGQSGMSHSISLLEPLRTKKIISCKDLEVYSVKGTPVDCVKLAINQLLPRKPDLMVSGINHGSNSAVSIIYSGTMGAAIEASLYGIPSIGFSVLDHRKTADFKIAVKYGRKVVEDVLKNGLPDQVALNVNFPVISEDDFKGFRICKQTKGVWKEEFDKRTDPYGGDYYWLTGDFHNLEPENEDSDEWALLHNYASIVPVKIDFTEYKTIHELKNRYK